MAPSALRSSLTGLALRAKLLAAGSLLLLTSLACVDRGGRYYWAWNDPRFGADSTCTSMPLGGGSMLRVHVADPGGDIRGARVWLTGADQTTVVEYATDVSGSVAAHLAPGQWQVNVVFVGFYPAHHSLLLSPDEVCTVTFELSLLDSSFPTVAENR